MAKLSLRDALNTSLTRTKQYIDTELAKKADSSHGTHLTLGTGSGNAFRGDFGNTAYTHSQAAHAPSNAQKNSDITKAEIEAKLTGVITSHTHSYLPLSGGTISGNIYFADVTSTTYPAKSTTLTWNGSTDGADIYYQVDASDKGRLVLNTRDDADCIIAFANKGTIISTIDNSGNFSGKAATATKATQDSAGQQINTTYIKGLSVSGKTITYTKGDGTTGTITTQDTNTTYSVGTASTLGLTKLYTETGTATDGTMTQAAIKTALDGKAGSSHGTHLTLGTGSGNAYRGDLGNTAYNHSQAAHAPSNAQKNSDITKLEIENKLTGTISSHMHDYITSMDTRSANSAPNTYATRGIYPEFKSTSTIGLPNVGKNFAGVITYQQWGDTTSWSGGKATQFATIDDGRMYFRKGEGTSWGAWNQFYTNLHKPDLEELGAAAANHNHTSLTGVTNIAFASGSSDTASMGTTLSDDITYFDFNLTDDTNADMWRWRFGAWDSSTSSTKTFDAMTLKATSTTKSQLNVNGSITADSFNGLNFWIGTQAQYDALSSKSSTTLYIIK